ncbi:MFS general substrate transporter [Stereum hirsutum FP-91666 SS1]|uniref:MFS general substrate transporter n=1 Tax=Stereum hirsutum (strain FP-91666) TaxID=721885 RepID=R7RVR3_STEHR|nr:MFS general substrate transporter [Stereum hirsutum FP-91666 SS1]EIM79256.1 MFS general substrate transporter [Stereum hirsutum FP-91666 SS1]
MVSSTEDSGSTTTSIIFHQEQDIGEAHGRHELESSRPPRRALFGKENPTSSSPLDPHPPLPESYELSTSPPPAAHILSRNVLEAGIGSEGITSRQAGRPSGDESPEMEEQGRPSEKQSSKYRWYARLHFAAICWCFFLQGWNDGTAGPLLPRVQSVYHIGFAIVSLIFVSTAIGFLAGAALNVHLDSKFGFGKVMVFGSLFQTVCYAMMIPEGPFAVRVVAYGVGGFGGALQLAGGNTFVGNSNKHIERKLGVMHALYGLGAFAAPLAATHFSQVYHWTFHFIISLGIAVTNTVVLALVFKGRTLDECMAEEGHPASEVNSERESGKYRQILSMKVVHALAIFTLVYVGTEVTLGGWIVTYIIQERSGGASSGYISSGFFGGITAGRLILLWLNKKIGERTALFLYAILCIGLEITVWIVPSLIENAVAISFVGVLMGPMYPILVNQAKGVIPRWLLNGSIGWIAAVGQSGSAIIPLVTGVLSAKFGIKSLQPLVVAMMGVLVGIWMLIPRAHRRAD